MQPAEYCNTINVCNAAGTLGQTVHHSLLLQMDEATGAVKAAELQEADVDVSDIALAATDSHLGVSFVVRLSSCSLANYALIC